MQALSVHIDEILEQKSRGKIAIPFGCMPLIIDGLVSTWEASTKWTCDYLRRNFGVVEVTCFVASRKDRSFLQQVNRPVTLSFADFLTHVYAETDGPLLYLRIDTEHALFDALSHDFQVPPLLEHYNASKTGIWIGEKYNVTPFHHDWWHSFLAQVSGRKRYTVVHPFEGELLQKDWDHAAAYDLASAPYLPPDDPKLDQFETCFEGVLEPGQVLYIPPYWFHQIETLDNGNISMPIRFDTPQSPNVPIYQFSQGTVLRRITNEQVRDADQLVDVLATNRQHFLAREHAFVEALVETRRLDTSAPEILDELDAVATAATQA